MVDEFDIEELVRGIGKLDDEADVTEYVWDNFNCDWYDFCKIIEVLMPLIVVGESPLTKKVYRGFGKDGMFFIKQEVKEKPSE